MQPISVGNMHRQARLEFSEQLSCALGVAAGTLKIGDDFVLMRHLAAPLRQKHCSAEVATPMHRNASEASSSEWNSQRNG